MKLEILNSSVVILGKEYSPNILSPDFLRSKEIVSKSWELAETPISNPVFSAVPFANGIVFQVEINKLQIQNTKPSSVESDSEISQLAIKFIKNFEYVRHTAVGINLAGFLDHDDPQRYLIDKFIKVQPREGNNFRGAALTLVYDLTDTTLRFSIDRGVLKREGKERNGIAVNANYHVDISSDLTLEATLGKTESVLSRSDEYFDHFRTLVRDIFETTE